MRLNKYPFLLRVRIVYVRVTTCDATHVCRAGYKLDATRRPDLAAPCGPDTCTRSEIDTAARAGTGQHMDMRRPTVEETSHGVV